MTVQDHDQQHDPATHGCCETEDDTDTRVTRRRFLSFASLATFVPVSVRSAVRRRVCGLVVVSSLRYHEQFSAVD
jgi:hypothetical protein